MDFLKSAVASAMAMQGPPFPYSFGDRVDIDQSIWTLNNGTKKEDGSPCSIFSFDITANHSRLPLARNALRKMRTMRHPGIIKVLDAVETETYIYIATERVTPLRWHIKRDSLSPETIKWGLFSVATTLKFVNEDAMSIHGAIRVASIYTSESGEWKLGGCDILSSVKDDNAVIYNYGTLVPDANRYIPPEIATSGWEVLRKNPHTAMDSFNFGTLIYECFNNGNYTGSYDAGQIKKIPPAMQPGYKRLVNPNPKTRLSVAHYLEQGRRSGSFFDSPLIKLTEGVDNLGMKSADERDEFLADLNELSDDFPSEFFKMKVLPEVLKSVEFGSGGQKALAVILKIGGKLEIEEFNLRVTPVIIRLFANPDRALRIALLDGLPDMIDKLPDRTVNDKIFPQITSGFTDASPAVREQTLKSVLVFVTKLSDRTVNGELLRHLAKTSNDEQPGIRTNTTICLGKLARHLNKSARPKVLLNALSRSLRDPFVHARNAALMAFAATIEYFSEEDCAVRIIPSISPLLIDKEKIIRDQASKSLDIYLQHIRKIAASMPESALPPPSAEPTGTTPRMSTPQPSADFGGWAGWAISSFTNKTTSATGEIESSSTLPATANLFSRPSTSVEQPPVAKPASSLHKQTVSKFASSAIDNIENSKDSWDNDDAADPWGDDAVTSDGQPMVDDDPWGEPKVPQNKKDNKVLPQEGEPDFAGWLAAQAKKPASKPLPKGLNKEGAMTEAAKKMAPVKKRPIVVKKIDVSVKDTGDDDGWGDRW